MKISSTLALTLTTLCSLSFLSCCGGGGGGGGNNGGEESTTAPATVKKTVPDDFVGHPIYIYADGADRPTIINFTSDAKADVTLPDGSTVTTVTADCMLLNEDSSAGGYLAAEIVLVFQSYTGKDGIFPAGNTIVYLEIDPNKHVKMIDNPNTPGCVITVNNQPIPVATWIKNTFETTNPARIDIKE